MVTSLEKFALYKQRIGSITASLINVIIFKPDKLQINYFKLNPKKRLFVKLLRNQINFLLQLHHRESGKGI